MVTAHKSNAKRIWVVFGVLLFITLIEVILGVIKPESLYLNGLGTSWLNWLFIVLTLVKARYIAWEFMHLEGEKKWFRRSIVWTVVFLISYMLFIMLFEGDYLYETLSHLVKW